MLMLAAGAFNGGLGVVDLPSGQSGGTGPKSASKGPVPKTWSCARGFGRGGLVRAAHDSSILSADVLKIDRCSNRDLRGLHTSSAVQWHPFSSSFFFGGDCPTKKEGLPHKGFSFFPGSLNN